MSDNVELVKAVQKVSVKVLEESRHELLSSVSNVVPKFSQMLLERGLITCTDQKAADLADDSVFERYVCGIARHCKVYEVQKHCEGLLEVLEELSGPPRDAAVALRSKLQSSIAREAGVDFRLKNGPVVVATFSGTDPAILTKKTFSKTDSYKELEKELAIHQTTATAELLSGTTSAEVCSEISMPPLHHFADQSPASIHSTLSGDENENDSNSDEQLEHPYENAQGCTSPRPIPTYNEGAANIDEQYKKIKSESNGQFNISTQQQIQLITACTQFSISRCQIEMQQHQQQLLHHQQQAQINLQNKPHQQQQEQHHYHQQQLRNRRQSSQNEQQANNQQNEHLQESNQLGLVTPQEQHNQQQIAPENNQPEHVQDLQQQLVLTPFLWFLFAAILVYNLYLHWDKVI